MDQNKLFHVLVLGGTALTLGAGCSSTAAPGPAQTGDSGAADTGAADTTAPADTSKSETQPIDGAPDVASDSISSFETDASGDSATCVDMSVCKWDAGIPFCDGLCCIWGAAHPCCEPFMAKDAGGD